MSLFAQAVSADVKYEGAVANSLVKKPVLVSAVRKNNKKTVKAVKKTNKKTTKQVKKTNSTKKTNVNQKTLAETVKKDKYFKLGDNNMLFVYVPANYHMVNSNAVQYKRYDSELAVINKNFYAKDKNFAKFYIVYDSQMSYNEFEKMFNKQKSNNKLNPLTLEQGIAKFKYFKIGKDGKIHIYSAAKGDYLNKEFYEENKTYTIMRKYQPFQKNYSVETTLDLQMDYEQWKNMVEGKEYSVKIINEKDKKQIEDAKSIKPVKDVKSASDEKFVKEFLNEKASILGNAEAMYILGELYFEGKYIEKDLSRAFEYYKQASEKKYPKTLYELGMLYLRGEIVNKDSNKAEEFIKESAKYGDERALKIVNKMGVIIESSQNDKEKYDIIKENDTIKSDKKGILSNVFISTFLLAIVIFFTIFLLGIVFFTSNKDSYVNKYSYLNNNIYWGEPSQINNYRQSLINDDTYWQSQIRGEAAEVALVTTLIGMGIGFIGMLIAYFKPKISELKYVSVIFVIVWLPTLTIF